MTCRLKTFHEVLLVWISPGLGALEVRRPGVREAEGKSLFGAFQILPMKGLKWRLRFENTKSVRLRKHGKLVHQVRTRRELSSLSARLLSRLLDSGSKLADKVAGR